MLCVLVGGCEERTRVERPVAPATPGPRVLRGMAARPASEPSFLLFSWFSGRSLIALDRAGYIPLTWVGR